MSILVTGNKGFIANGLPKFFPGEDIYGIDIKDGSDVVTYKRNGDYSVVIHTAAKISVTESMANPEEYVRTNVMGTLNMLKQHPDAHFIYLSTAGIYGEGKCHTIDSPARPTSVYAVTKYAGEWLVRNLARTWSILRLTNVIGEGERGEPNVYQIFKASNVLEIFGDGLQTRDFVDVNVVRRVIAMSLYKQGIVNVGSGKSRTVLEVAREFGKPLKFSPARPGEVRDFGVEDAFHIDS